MGPSLPPSVGDAADDRAVSAVVGTLLILAMTIIGIAGVLVYGAPIIDRIQSRNAQVAMAVAFESLRDSVQELSVPDHARYPSITIPAGELSVQKGDRFLVTANHDADNQACDLRIKGWNDPGGDTDVEVTALGCRNPTTACTTPMADGSACFEIHGVTGSTVTRQSAALAGGVATVGSADFAKGDWLFRLTDGNLEPVVYAEAWLHSTDQLAWQLQSSTGTWEQFFEAGAVFSATDGSYFMEKEATIGDAAFGPGYYGFWLRTLIVPGAAYTSIQDTSSHSILFSLMGVSTRIDDAATYLLRYDINGPLAEPWCNSFLLRNDRFGPAASPSAEYRQDGDATCPLGDADGTRSVTFACLTCPGAGAPFQFRFLNARVATSLAV